VKLIETSHVPQGGRITNNYVPAANGRVTPQMQEQDPRRDVLGAIGKNQKNVAASPRKNRNQSIEQTKLDQTPIITGESVIAKRTR